MLIKLLFNFTKYVFSDVKPDENIKLTDFTDSNPEIQKNGTIKYNLGNLSSGKMRAEAVILPNELPTVDEKSKEKKEKGQIPNEQFNIIKPIMPEDTENPYVS